MALTSPAAVIRFTGVSPEDLNVTTAQELTDLVSEWIVQVSDLIKANRKRDFETPGPIPPGIQNIALRATANMVGYAIQRRMTPSTSYSDFDAELIRDQVLTPDILRDLENYPKPFYFNAFTIAPPEEI